MVTSCATSRERLWALDDPTGDVRLAHPTAPGVGPGTFDLERVEIWRRGGRVEVEVTFAAPVRRLEPQPEDVDQRLPWFLPTVDVYLDTEQARGSVPALPGRHFYVPATHAYDRVLVLGAHDTRLPIDAFRALHLVAHGRVMRATFPAGAIDGEVLGGAAVVLATAFRGEGEVRQVGVLKGDCATWDEARCTLNGSGPPVLDATGTFQGDVLPLSYVGKAPAVVAGRAAVAFLKESLVTVAPLDAALGAALRSGTIATLLDANDRAIATAVVDTVVPGAATLRIIGELPDAVATTVVFNLRLDAAPAVAPTPTPAPTGGD